MYSVYHAIMFAVVLIGGIGVIFKVSSVEQTLVTKSISIKATESKFDLNTY